MNSNIHFVFFSLSSIKKKVKKGSGSKTLPSNSSPVRGAGPESPGARRVEPTEALGTAVVKYNYQAQQPDELSLTKGTRILILEKSNDGWWRGQYQGHTGWYVICTLALCRGYARVVLLCIAISLKITAYVLL